MERRKEKTQRKNRKEQQIIIIHNF
jgi:hypothetical protein